MFDYLKILNNYNIIRKLYARIINSKNYIFKNYYKLITDLGYLNPWDPLLDRKVARYMIDYSANSSIYGIMYALKKYSGVSKPVYNTIPQHGVYMYGVETSFNYNYCKKVILMGNKMKEEMNELEIDKPVLEVGPYIQYASDYWAIETQNIYKKIFGKTLIVFLPHGHKYNRGYVSLNDLIYTDDNIITRILPYKKIYKSVIVMGWPRTSNKSTRQKFTDAGFIYAISGDPNDYNFLSRQKSVIKLGHHSVSFSISTHVGYCLTLGVSHEVIHLFHNQNFDATNIDKYLSMKVKKKNINNPLEYINTMYSKDLLSSLDNENPLNGVLNLAEYSLLKVFFNSGSVIHKMQLQIIKPFWGYGIVRSPDEIKNFLQ